MMAPQAEVVLEVTYVHLAVLAKMRPEFRMLPLMPGVDGQGRRMARVGRAFQPQWFEAVLLDASDLNCISREACEFCWGGPDPSHAQLTMRVLGTGTLLVDEAQLARGETVPLHPGSRIAFASLGAAGELCPIIAVAVHCAACVALMCPPGPALGFPAAPRAGFAGTPAGQLGLGWGGDARSPVHSGRAASQAEDAPVHDRNCWALEYVFAAGAPGAFLALPAAARRVSFDLAPEKPPGLLGRAHQPDFFEALLSPELLTFVSRSHFRLEADSRGCGVAVTNLSQNVALVARERLHQGDKLLACAGDTLSFTCGVQEGASSPDSGRAPFPEADPGASRAADGDGGSALTVFLTLRLVGPPPTPPASPWTALPSVAPHPPLGMAVEVAVEVADVAASDGCGGMHAWGEEGRPSAVPSTAPSLRRGQKTPEGGAQCLYLTAPATQPAVKAAFKPDACSAM